MASTSASLDLSISTRVLLLLLLLIGCCRPSSSASLHTQLVPRWRNPCGGESAVVDNHAEDTGTMTTVEARDTFARLSSRSTVLKQLVNSLKNDYVVARFIEARLVEDWVSAGFIVAGSPSWTTHDENIRETLLACYENLARLAVLTQRVREGEQSAATTERHHFASRFQDIEDNHESGLYVLMCSLHALMESLGIETMSPATAEGVASISLQQVESNAVRHVRDYLVLLAVETSADKLSSSFDRLVGQVASQITTPSVPQ